MGEKMNEKMLRFVISAAPTIIFLACISLAFATHGWNVQKAIFAEDPTKTFERILPFQLGAENRFLEVKDIELSKDRSRITIEAIIHSPFNVPIKIEELSAEVKAGDINSIIRLPNEVEIPAKGSVSLKLEGALPEQSALPPEVKPALRNIEIKLNGIELKWMNQ